MYKDEELLPLSALQHFLFCPRQCALIHIEQLWEENLFTAQGRVMHENAHEERYEQRKDVRIERGVSLRSFSLGLIGKADVIEFHKVENLKTQISNLRSLAWVPFPVEYKRGKPKANDCDKVQLCAQAMCLEEMLNTAIPAGALYYGKTRHRMDVEFAEELRRETKETARILHEMIKKGKTPRPEYEKKCESCSLVGLCMPRLLDKTIPVDRYLEEELIKP